MTQLQTKRLSKACSVRAGTGSELSTRFLLGPRRVGPCGVELVLWPMEGEDGECQGPGRVGCAYCAQNDVVAEQNLGGPHADQRENDPLEGH